MSDIIIELDMQAMAGCVHDGLQICASFGTIPEELSGLFASWDTLVGAPMPTEDSTLAEYINRIHRQVDAVLNGSAVITIKD